METAKPTTHAEPTYVVDDVIHYGVANMPGAVARTSTYGLTNATIPYVRRLAKHGAAQSVRDDRAIRSSANVVAGKVTYEAVAKSFGVSFVPPEQAV